MYLITVAYDGNPAHWEKTYTDFSKALEEFEKHIDWGFADEYSTVTLRIPSGELTSKTFYRRDRLVVRK